MDAVKLRPHAHLFTRGTAATFAFFIPASGGLYFLTIPDGPWPIVVAAQVVFLGLYAFALRAYLRLGIWVSPTEITEQGFFARTHLRKEQLSEAIFVNTFHGGWVDTVPQLFICDGKGKQLLRMRGQFWSRESMFSLASTLEIPFTEIGQDVSTAELRATYPGLLYWFERRPVLVGALVTALLVIAGTGLFVLLRSLEATG